jgi:hypothetical protein
MGYEDLLGAAMLKAAKAEGHKPKLPDNVTADRQESARRTRLSEIQRVNEALLSALSHEPIVQSRVSVKSGISNSATRDGLWRLANDGLAVGVKTSNRAWLWRLA